MIVLALAGAIGIGGASVISRRLGEGRKDHANIVFGNILCMVVGVGALGVVCAFLLLKPLLRLFGATEVMMPYAADYLFPILMGTAISSFVFISNNLIRSEGHAKIVFILMALGSLLNMGFDPIFILVLKLGTQGAAIATILAQTITATVDIFYFGSGKSHFSLGLKSFQLKLQVIREVLVIGLPMSIQLISESLMVVVVNHMLVTYSGALAVGVFGIIYRIMTSIIMPINGVGQGMQPIVGYNYGAKYFQRLSKTIILGLKVATIVSLIIFAVMMIIPDRIMHIFSSDQVTLEKGTQAIRMIFAGSFLIGIQVISNGIYQALGFARKALFLSMSRQVLFLIPLVLILPRFLGITGVWLAFPTADFFAFCVSSFLMYRDRQRLISE